MIMPHLFSLISWFIASTNSHISSTIAFLSAWSLQCLPENFKTSGLAITAYTKGVHFGLLLENIWKVEENIKVALKKIVQ